MTEQEYIEFVIKQGQLMTTEIKNAIIEQRKLHSIAVQKREEFDALYGKSVELLKTGSEKFFEKYPEYRKEMESGDTKIEVADRALKLAINTPDKLKEITAKMKEIPELEENDKLNSEIAKASYDYFVAFTNLTDKINKDREELFSAKYKEKLSALADEGIILYFLETPDLPLLDDKYDGKFLLNTFYVNDCIAIKTMLQGFFMDNPSPSMMRKADDLFITVELLNSGYYRSAARNLFALLDSEHKKAANAFEGYFDKRKKYSKGHLRAEKIRGLVDKLNIDWETAAWEKVNKYFQKVTSTNPVDGVIHRNSIVHGDYYNTLLDIDKYDVIKLFLLWLNMRLIADLICNIDEMYDMFLQCLPGYILNKLHKNN